MKKLVSSILMSIDGFAGGPNGELDMFPVDEKFFDLANQLTQQADTALYGRKTYDVMQNYWPTAADKPNASQHDKEHSSWYNKVNKVVISKMLKSDKQANITVISTNIKDEIIKLKQRAGKNIQIFGSPSIVNLLMPENLIDEYWWFVAPVVIGTGIPIFNDFKSKINLKLLSTMSSDSGIVGLHYEKQ
jgi:dihydrofolate reductase